MGQLPTDKTFHQSPSASSSIGTILRWLTIFFIVVLGLWFALADVFKISAKTMEFAGQMSGVLFTLGGIVIALASLVTLVSIEDRVKAAFSDAQNTVMTQYEAQVNAQVEAHLAFLRATLASDWRQADKEARDAIQKYPALSGVRSFIGLKMFEQVQSVFYLNHVDFQGRFDAYSIRPSMNTSPVQEALEWLQDAVKFNDRAVTCQASLAMLSSILGRYDKTIEYLSTLPDSEKPALLNPLALISLGHACFGREDGFRTIGQQLHIEWPIPLQTVHPWITNEARNAHQQENALPAYFKWWVSPKAATGINAKEYPRVVLIRPFNPGNPEIPSNASYWASGNFRNIPESDRGEGIPFDELMQQLGERFWFLCPDDTDQTQQLLRP